MRLLTSLKQDTKMEKNKQIEGNVPLSLKAVHIDPKQAVKELQQSRLISPERVLQSYKLLWLLSQRPGGWRSAARKRLFG